MPIIKLDIDSLVDSDMVIVALEHKQLDLLVSLSEQLLWRATWGASLDDGQVALIESLQDRLMERVNMNELISAIEYGFLSVESAIKSLSFAVNMQSPCCDYVAPGDLPDNPELPAPGGEEPPPGWDGYDDLVCDLLNGVYWLVVRYMEFVTGAHWVLLGAAAIAALLAALFPEPVTTALGSVSLVAIAGALIAAIAYTNEASQAFESFVSWIENNQLELFCRVKNAIDLATGVHNFAESLMYALRDSLVSAGMPEWISGAITSWIGINSVVEHLVSDFITNHVTQLEQPPEHRRLACACSETADCLFDVSGCTSAERLDVTFGGVTYLEADADKVLWTVNAGGSYTDFTVTVYPGTVQSTPDITLTWTCATTPTIRTEAWNVLTTIPGNNGWLIGKCMTSGSGTWKLSMASSVESSIRPCLDAAIDDNDGYDRYANAVPEPVLSMKIECLRPSPGTVHAITGRVYHCWYGVQ